MPHRTSNIGLSPLEDRLAMVSVLQELTAAAFLLFSPDASIDEFLERLALRLSCRAVLWIDTGHEARAPCLEGAAGLSDEARHAVIGRPATLQDGTLDWAHCPLPYPEIEPSSQSRWVVIPPHDVHDADGPVWVLLLVFQGTPPVPPRYHGLAEKVAKHLCVALRHRRLYARTLRDEQNHRVLNEALVNDARERAEILAREQAARSEAEALALRLSQERTWQHAVLDLMPIGLAFLEPMTAKMTFANRAAQDMLDVQFDGPIEYEQYGARFHCFDDEGREIPALARPAMRAARGERLEQERVQCVTREGVRTLMVSSETLPTMHGHPATVVIPFQDATRLVDAEEALRSSEARQRALLSAIPDLIFRIRRDGTFVDYHAERTQDLLVPPERIRGMNLGDVGLPPSVVNEALEAIEAVLRDGTVRTFEYSSNVGGRHFTREARVARAGTDEVVLISRDVTERRAAEMALAALTRDLESRVVERTTELAAANAELESFSYSVSHDLRAPLRAIDGFANALYEEFGAALPPPAREYLARVRGASQRMSQLVDALLDLSRVTRREMHREPVDLSQLAHAVVADLRKSTAGRNVDVTIEPDLTAHGDPRLLRALLENLLGNAWKFTSRTPTPGIVVGRTSVDGTEAFFVRDNGAGFDMAYAGKLFGAFQRLHAAREYEGTGIGLATVQRIVHRHGGRVWAEAAVNQGATFYFTL